MGQSQISWQENLQLRETQSSMETLNSYQETQISSKTSNRSLMQNCWQANLQLLETQFSFEAQRRWEDLFSLETLNWQMTQISETLKWGEIQITETLKRGEIQISCLETQISSETLNQ